MTSEKTIIIIGGGAAGLSAAVNIAEQGGHAIVLEKNPKVGGNGVFAEVMFGLNTKEQAKRGIVCDLDGYYKLSMEHSHYKNNARLLRTLLSHTAENVDWLTEHGLEIADLQEEGAPGLGKATHHTADMHTGQAVMEILRETCEAHDGIEIHTRCEVQKLLKSGEKIIGAEAREGENTTQYCGDGVIIACGGFAGNPDLISRINPAIDVSAFGHLRGIQMDGRGILLAESVGAEICSDGCFESAGPTFLGDAALMGLVTKRYAIWLNCQGRRFVDESVGDNFVFGCNAVYAQPGHFCYVMLDQAMVEQAVQGPVDFLAGPEANAKGLEGLQRAIDQEIKTGRVCRSDSMEVLASWMNVPENVLREEIESYNDGCRNGLDELFMKPAELLKPLEQGPILCIRCGVDFILTHGGIRVDERFRVLRNDGSAIPGLYAAGADISGIDASGYQVSMGGHSFGFSLTGGRLVADAILKEQA